MPVTVRLPPQWRRSAGGAKEMVCEPGTLGDILASVASAHPKLRSRLFGADDQILPTLRLLLNGRTHVPDLGAAIELRDDDQLSILAAVGGG